MASAVTATRPQTSATQRLDVSIVMPCLNEAETLRTCIEKALAAIEDSGVEGEVIIADNGSTDGSQAIAAEAGARVVAVPEKGYGSALRGGIQAARGRYIVMGDADDSYNFGDLPHFLDKLRKGNDLVMGNRFRGGIEAGAMPPLHRYLGNPVLTGIGRLLFGSPVGDFHCGLRAFSKEAFAGMELQSGGMEFASEMVVRATLLKMRIAEVPTTLRPDGRSRAPHLRTWRDGWRHLRFLLWYSPRWLFLYPGVIAMGVGLLATLWLLAGPRHVHGVVFDIHTLMFAAMMVLVGFQAIDFAVFAKIFGVTQGLLPQDNRLDKLFRYVTLETGLIAGGLFLLLGLGGTAFAIGQWALTHFGPLDPVRFTRLVMPSLLSLTLGLQIILSSFFLSLLGLAKR